MALGYGRRNFVTCCEKKEEEKREKFVRKGGVGGRVDRIFDCQNRRRDRNLATIYEVIISVQANGSAS